MSQRGLCNRLAAGAGLEKGMRDVGHPMYSGSTNGTPGP